MEEFTSTSRRSFAGPLILIAVGLIFLFTNIGIVEASTWELISQYWPVLLIILGLDNLVRGEGFAGPILTLGIGTLFLFANLDVIELDIWQVILQFWPVVIIAIGLDIIFSRQIHSRTILAPVLGLLVIAALVGGIIGLSGNRPAAFTAERVHQTAEGVEEADLRLNPITGILRLDTLDDPSVLLEGTVRLSRTEELTTEGDVQGSTTVVNMKSDGFALLPTFNWNAKPAWDISINNRIPTHLGVDMALGESNLNLRSANLASLDVSNVMGRTIVVLPQGGSYQADLSGVMGELIVRVPLGVSIEFELDPLVTAVEIPDGYTRAGDLVQSPNAGSNPSVTAHISQVVGSIRIQEIQ